MTRILLVATLCVLGADVHAQQAELPTLAQLPGVIKGNLDANDGTMPVELDRAAKGGPADQIRFVVARQSRIRLMLECDSCAPKLILTSADSRVIKRAEHWVTAALDASLAAGTYSVWIGTSKPSRGGAYALTVSDSAQELLPTLPTFDFLAAAYQAGTKQVTAKGGARIGWNTFTFETEKYELFKQFPLTDIVAVEQGSVPSTDASAAVTFGAFAGRTQQQLITVRTATEYVVLQVPGKYAQTLTAALQNAIAQRKK